jgi:hydrophobic/amphiphilic exporter-1 (mainly G- bacteria), HAE1 family
MFVDFFIKRPVFTTVCSLIILLLGAIAIPNLPIAQYPEISPIQVNVTANYIGADAQTVEDTVTTLLEQEINGVEGMRYISSSSSNDGTSSITVTFDSATDQDIAAVDVQNRVSIAEPRLPETVRQTGVTVTKQSSSLLLAMSLFSENNEYDNIFLSNYADLYMVDAIRRIDGVGNVTIFGERTYAMRLWLDPRQLASRNLTAEDVADALEEQNIEIGAGRIGQQPAASSQQYQIDIRAISRLETVPEFEALIVGTAADGSPIELRDVGRVELGAEDYNGFLRFRGQEAIGLGIYQLPNSNALDVANAVKAEMASLSQQFPPGMKYGIGFDTTEFVETSLNEVLINLVQAVVLVILIIFLFLQDWRTVLIPTIIIPIALIGTFAFVKAFNFSINSLTLFGLTLAIGGVVDDAIVVVEDITSKIENEGLRPTEAAIQAMRELTGAILASSLVLMAVFIPVAFFPGTTGALYQQIALTIAFTTAISSFNALTMTPSLSALLLRPRRDHDGWLDRIFQQFNRFLDWTSDRYGRLLEFLKNFKAVVIGLFIVSLGMTAWLYVSTPSAFLPDEDQGYFITLIQGPEGVSLNYTDKVIKQIETEILKIPEVRATFAVGGFSFSGSTSNNGIIFTTLIPWDERPDSSQTAQAIIERLTPSLGGITEARVLSVNPPAIAGLGSYGGFQFQLQDRRGNLPLEDLVAYRDKLIGAASSNPDLQAVFSTYAANTPQLLVEVNRRQAKSLDVNIDEIFNTLQAYLGSQYVNDFVFEGRSYRVYIQADQQFRSNPESIQQLYVRSDEEDQMIPLGNLVTVTSATGAQTINHYNLFRAIEISGQAGEGASSGDAIKAMEQVAAQVLPASLGYEWTGTALDELESGSQAPIIFGLGVVFVFLVLAAQYESFIDPIIILLAVPLAIFGALAAQSLRGFPNDVYCQIGLVMLIGLASKNSILIVEFANQLRKRGLSITNAAIQSARQRLRPILMTAISTIVGTFPLVIAVGAGAGSRQSLGTAVFGGMLVATFLSLFVTPILYIVIKQSSDRILPGKKNKRRDNFEVTDSSHDGRGRLLTHSPD